MDQFPKASLSELNTHFYAVDWVKEAWNICKKYLSKIDEFLCEKYCLIYINITIVCCINF